MPSLAKNTLPKAPDPNYLIKEKEEKSTFSEDFRVVKSANLSNSSSRECAPSLLPLRSNSDVKDVLLSNWLEVIDMPEIGIFGSLMESLDTYIFLDSYSILLN